MSRTSLVAAALAVVTLAANGQTSQQICRQQYAASVQTCAQNLDHLPPNERAGVQKACVQQAQTTRDACLAGVSPGACLANCQATYTNQVQVCETTFNPAVCDGATTCEAIILAQRAECIDQATVELNQCVSQCPP